MKVREFSLMLSSISVPAMLGCLCKKTFEKIRPTFDDYILTVQIKKQNNSLSD